MTDPVIVLRGGTIYDGSGGEPLVGDLVITGEVIASVGGIAPNLGETVDARGLAVAPGFVNMLSHSQESLIADGRSQSDIRQGVTLEVIGEGWSMGPWNNSMKEDQLARQRDIRYPVEWTTLDEYLEWLVARGIACNIGSFVGATTIRVHVLGYADRPPSDRELAEMRQLARAAMRDGALGLSSALFYAPASFAQTSELVALARVARDFGGIYISHLRNEGNGLIAAVDELIEIARAAQVPAEIFHLKAAGADNWPKLDEVVDRVEAARSAGIRVTADMYPYVAGSTGLEVTMPRWVQEGGHREWVSRLRDPVTRERVVKEMRSPRGWESMLKLAGSADNVLLSQFKSTGLKHLTGRRLAEVARERGKPPEDTIIDLVVEDDSRVEAVYFMMSEDNVRRQISLPWMSFCSDSPSLAPEDVFLQSQPHPRAYGTFTRLLGMYVRELGVISLQEAIRRLTSLPAETLGLRRRGALRPGYVADIAVFDPARVRDQATFERPHQYATGVVHVFVNGTQVLKDGEHTGKLPGQVVRGRYVAA